MTVVNKITCTPHGSARGPRSVTSSDNVWAILGRCGIPLPVPQNSPLGIPGVSMHGRRHYRPHCPPLRPRIVNSVRGRGGCRHVLEDKAMGVVKFFFAEADLS